MDAPIPDSEYSRLMALASYEILDTAPEVAFDRVTRLAAHVLNTPYAYINFVDRHRLWNKSGIGFPLGEPERASAFCSWTILQDAPLVVENTQLDPRFHDAPAVRGELAIRSYAGAPLTTPSGHRIGTLCVMDTQPHPLNAADLQALQDLADTVVSELELRMRNLHLSRELGAQAQFSRELSRTLDQARVLEGVNSLMDLDLDPEHMTLSAAALLGEAIASDYTCLLVIDDELRIEAAYARPGLPPVAHALPAGPPAWPSAILRTLRTLSTPLYLSEYASAPGAVPEVVGADIDQIALLPLDTRGQTTSVLLAVRLHSSPVKQWRGSDRALLESAGRSVRSALDRQVLTRAALQQARQDPLTSLLNRRAFDEDIQSWQEEDMSFTLSIIDLDGFKNVNDSQGHLQGDVVLRVFGSTLSAALDGQARLYRFGGDEFVLLTPSGEQVTGPQRSWDTEAIHEVVDLAILAARQVATLGGASVGMAHSHEASGETLLGLADTRMYTVKQRRQTLRHTPLISSGSA
ncbi:sensor domain-containing diguanylate cyclase [Deinococcus ruber]|uniref:Diguanylate cyclase n=1 Tax=Deinococcus ruber TaxID=1848197 RepID=A0A918C6B3_9DEIO|nr:sensor domain-containing diguanylate cyclase [Deinococcus ruber]GGR08018.1 diguanylate cyclase [Deinococcus ruber]